MQIFENLGAALNFWASEQWQEENFVQMAHKY
jgi:hypothetical protein